MKQLIITARELRERVNDPKWGHLTEPGYLRMRMLRAGMSPRGEFSREDTAEGHIVIRQRARAYVPPHEVDDDGGNALVAPLMASRPARPPLEERIVSIPLFDPVTIALLVLGAGIVAAIVLVKLGIL